MNISQNRGAIQLSEQSALPAIRDLIEGENQVYWAHSGLYLSFG
jgi:hypothetical protein